MKSYKSRMKGRVDVWWEKQNGLNSHLNIPYNFRMKNFVTIPFRNRMKGRVDVWWEKQYKISNNLCVPAENNINGTIAVPFRNRMKGYFDILSPERKVAILDPIEDSFVSKQNPFMIFGQGNSLLLGENNEYQSLLKFDSNKVIPNFNKDNIILLDAYLKLTIDNVRRLKTSTTIDIFECFSNWKELSVTYNNKPIISNNILKSFNIIKNKLNNNSIEIDIKDIVLKWLLHPKKNNGIVINSSQKDIISFFSKENGNKLNNPNLVLRYIDLNSPFVIKENGLKSSIEVWEKNQNQMISTLEVLTKHSTKTTPSNLLVLQHPGDLFASIEIVKDKIFNYIDIVGDNIKNKVNVYINKTKGLKNNLYVNGIAPENKIRISHSNEIINKLKLVYGKYLNGFLGINPNKLINSIDIHSWNNIINLLTIHQYWKINNNIRTTYEDYIRNNFHITSINNVRNNIRISCKDNIQNNFYIIPMNDLKSELEILASESLKSDIFYGRFADLISYLEITPQSNLINNLIISSKFSVNSYVKTLALRQLTNKLKYSNLANLTNYISTSNVNMIKIYVDIVGKYLNSTIGICAIETIKNSFGVQGRTLTNKIDVSIQESINSFVRIMEENKIINNIKIINEHLENIINIYVKKHKYCDARIDVLENSLLNCTLNSNYGNELVSKLNLYVDRISVLNSYVQVNNDNNINSQRGYGYIM